MVMIDPSFLNFPTVWLSHQRRTAENRPHSLQPRLGHSCYYLISSIPSSAPSPHTTQCAASSSVLQPFSHTPLSLQDQYQSYGPRCRPPLLSCRRVFRFSL